MGTAADAYGSMTVLTVDTGITQGECEAFRHVGDEQIRSGGRWFVVDFSRANTFDSSGLEELLAFQDKVEQTGGTVKLAGLKGQGHTIFAMTRLDRKFEIFESVHEAVRNFY